MRAFILGARPGNIGGACVAEFLQRGFEVRSTDCMIGDGSRPRGGSMNRDWALEHGYAETPKGHYARYDAPAYDEFLDFDADTLVVSLGSTYKDHFADATAGTLERVIRANLILPLESARRYVQAVERVRSRFPETSEGDIRRIIFIGSYAYRHPFTNGTAYCAAKAGIDMAARSLGWELTDRDYRVHVVHPYHVPGTPMWAEVERGVMESKGWTKEEADAYAHRDLKMPRACTPADVARAVADLATVPSLEWTSGTAIELFGGTR